MRRWLTVAGLVIVLGWVALYLGADSAPVRALIVDQVQRASGHPAEIGPVRVVWRGSPGVAIEGIRLLNPAGFSGPALFTARRVVVQVKVLGLLRGGIELSSVEVTGPDLLLERDASGRGNWERVERPPAEATPAPTQAAPRAPPVVDLVRLTDGRAELRGFPALLLERLDVSPSGGGVSGQVKMNGVPLTVSGRVDPAGVALEAAGGGLAASVTKRAGSDGAFKVNAGNLATAGVLFGQALPPLQNASLTGAITGEGVRALRLMGGMLDLGVVAPGLHVTRLEATASALDQPVQVVAAAELNGLPIAAAMTITRGGAMVRSEARLTADGAEATVQGSYDVAARSPDLVVSAKIADLQRLGAAAGVALPALTAVTFDARVLGAPGNEGLLLRGLRVGSAQGDLAGDLAVSAGGRPFLRGSLVSQRLDFDAWTAFPAAAPPPGAAPAAAPATTPPGGAAVTPLSRWVIPDQPIPLAGLIRADADLRVTAGEVVVRQITYRQLEARVLLQQGRFRLDPASVLSPGGAVQGSVQIDAAAEPPTVAIVLRAPVLDVAGVASAVGLGGALTGTVDLDMDLRTAGATPHAMAGALNGRLIAVVTDGDVDNALLARLAAPVLDGAGLNIDASGRSKVRCLGGRFDVVNGVAAIGVLGLDTTRLRMDGEGKIDLGRETLDLHLRPTARVGNLPIAVPIVVVGGFRSPRPQLERGAISPGRFGFSLGAGAPDPCTGLAGMKR